MFSIAQPMNNRRLTKLALAPGKPIKRASGGWVADLAALGKAILLCGRCRAKFKESSVGYKASRVAPAYNYVIGDCDGCRDKYAHCTLFTKETK